MDNPGTRRVLGPDGNRSQRAILAVRKGGPCYWELGGLREKGSRDSPVGVNLAAVDELLGRVLVVDDDEVIRQLIAVNLSLEGFQVETATDGQDCLERVASVRPDVITLDVMMPRLDGWMTATKLRADESTRHIKIMMITARAQEDDKKRGLGIGVDAYLTKPFDPAELIQAVRDLALAARTTSA